MSYDDDLAARVRQLLSPREDLTERRFFGGLAFMIAGNLCCGVMEGDLMVRVGADGYREALALRHTRPVQFATGSMTGLVYVAPEGFASEPELAGWVARAVCYSMSLPAKMRRRPRYPKI